MRAAIAYLFFCFFCLNAFFYRLPGSQPQHYTRQLVVASLMLGFSFYLLVAGLLLIGAYFLGVQVVQSFWLSAAVIVSFMLTVFSVAAYFYNKQRGLLILQHYAPLVEQRKWLYPVTAILFFVLGFSTFVAGAAKVA